MMRDRDKKGNMKGSITIFLAMVFLLILAVVLVTLESARVTAVKSSMSMALSQSMDSVLADYYLPLFEEYQIFGRLNDGATDSLIQKSLEAELMESLQYVSNPLYGLEEVEGNLHAALPAKVYQAKVTDITYLDNYQSDTFYLQAVEAVKFQGVQTFLDTMLEKCNLLSESAGASKAFSMQSEVTEKLADLDEVTMELMGLIDGIVLEDGELEVTQGSLLACNEMFAKKYVKSPVSMTDVKLNHSVVFESLRQHYIDKYEVYAECSASLQQIIHLQLQINELEAEYEQWIQSLEQLEQEIRGLQEQIQNIDRELSTIMGRIVLLSLAPRRNQAEIARLQTEASTIREAREGLSQACSEKEAERNRLDVDMEELRQKIEELSESKTTLRHQFSSKITEVEEDLLSCQNVLFEAIEKTKEGIQQQSEAQGQVTSYEASLNELKGSISDEIFSSLSEELDEMKGYVGAESSSSSVNYDYEQMKVTLEYDYNLLKEGIQYVANQQLGEDTQSLEGLQQILLENQQMMNEYSIDALEFDYSTLNLNQTTEQSAIDTMKDTISSGVLNLVLEDSGIVSEQSIDTSGLPSTLAGVMHTELPVEDQSQQLSVLDKSILGDLLDSFTELFSNDGSFGSFSTDLLELGLFQVYQLEYFKDYTVKEKPAVETVLYPSVLNYEKEYMCFHQESDKENLTSMIYTLFFLRLVVNMISLFSNSECNQKARATATALVAFTGLSFLVSITKMLILTAWAVIETFIDVAILLKGKELAVFDLKTQHMSYEELLTVNKSVMMKKASEYESTSQLTMDYDQYLFIFLLMQSKQSKCYSTMDLIQANLNYRYEGEFELSRCIYGFETEFEYQIDPLYSIGMDLHGGLQCKKNIQLSY